MARKKLEPAYTSDFLSFWFLYPQQNSNGRWFKPGKWEAFLVWFDMPEELRSHAMYSVKLYKECVKDGRYVCHARTWLHQRRYEDWDMPEEKGEHLPASMTANVLKGVPKATDLNDARNKQIAALRNKV